MPYDDKDTLTIEQQAPPPVMPEVFTPAPPAVPDWDISLFNGMLIGALIGGLLLGMTAFIIARGFVPIAALRILGASGALPAVIVGAGAGIGFGGIAGGLATLLRLPGKLRNLTY